MGRSEGGLILRHSSRDAVAPLHGSAVSIPVAGLLWVQSVIDPAIDAVIGSVLFRVCVPNR